MSRQFIAEIFYPPSFLGVTDQGNSKLGVLFESSKQGFSLWSLVLFSCRVPGDEDGRVMVWMVVVIHNVLTLLPNAEVLQRGLCVKRNDWTVLVDERWGMRGEIDENEWVNDQPVVPLWTFINKKKCEWVILPTRCLIWPASRSQC